MDKRAYPRYTNEGQEEWELEAEVFEDTSIRVRSKAGRQEEHRYQKKESGPITSRTEQSMRPLVAEMEDYGSQADVQDKTEGNPKGYATRRASRRKTGA